MVLLCKREFQKTQNSRLATKKMHQLSERRVKFI